MKNEVYDKLKWGTTIGLPATGTLYFALAGVWGWGYTTQVLGTIAALTTFLGVVLGLSTKQYNNSDAKFDGTLNMNPSEDGTLSPSLEFNSELTDIQSQKALTLKVN